MAESNAPKKRTSKKPRSASTSAKTRTKAAETVTEKSEVITAVIEAEPTVKEVPVVETNNREIEELKALVRQLQDELAARKPQIVQVMADTERVVMRFQAEVADDNVTIFGPDGMYGQVTGKAGTVAVPKSEWSRFYNESVRNMISRRWLIALSGMDEQERELYGCNYKPGEILDDMAFHKMLDLGRDLIAIFPALCPDHQAMVASRFITAWYENDDRVKDRELVVALNEMSKEPYKNADKHDLRRKGLFWPIIEGLNAEDAAE